MPVTIVDSLCAYFACNPHRLKQILRNAVWAQRASAFLAGREVRTLHQTRCENAEFEFGGLTSRGSHRQHAYEGYCGVTVRQHFYVRHRKKLNYPTLPCAIHMDANGEGHHAYYPLEVLELI